MAKRSNNGAERLNDSESRNANRIDDLSANVNQLNITVSTLNSSILNCTSKMEMVEKLWNNQISHLATSIQVASSADAELGKRVTALEAFTQEAKGSFKGAASITMSAFSFVGFLILAAIEFAKH
jgi:hypothetical protein